MKTDELINLLAADSRPPVRYRRFAGWTLAGAVAASLLLLLVSVGLRPGMMDALTGLRVAFKVTETALTALLASRLALLAGRPGQGLRQAALALVAPAGLLAVAVGAELYVLPAEVWGRSLLGKHAAFCVFFIPVLALAPLAAFLLALKQAAPDNPGLAGGLAGLAAGSIAASIYAWHCPDDSPLFLATWYGTAVALVCLAGFLTGRRLLKW